MSNEGPDPNRELGPFWIHAIAVYHAELQSPGLPDPVSAVQIIIEGETLGHGDFTATIGLPMKAAEKLIDLLCIYLREQGIVR